MSALASPDLLQKLSRRLTALGDDLDRGRFSASLRSTVAPCLAAGELAQFDRLSERLHTVAAAARDKVGGGAALEGGAECQLGACTELMWRAWWRHGRCLWCSCVMSSLVAAVAGLVSDSCTGRGRQQLQWCRAPRLRAIVTADTSCPKLLLQARQI